ncbi:DUF4362 domain-containing protein [Clostridium estertheticum]|uniref:DUF4362 domain-containing protein n=1 Tax=Clostridium estertheticum TaxID=238834 RepID=A0AA47I7Z2_9CLOT|nr:DUF4362 domain-containing protein [Clostridium estertheticum]MBU3158076.1 DUF4362 domain-containing protein [Clostridium estertheticum]WAG63202.1 DUF4362 domain-containing protein [Clostridium estertheticum]
MKRALTFVLLLFILVFIPIQSSKAYTTTGTLNNKTLTSDIAIKDGDVVMIAYTDSVSSKTHNNMEIYNINRLDNFMKNMDKGKKDNIRIVDYAKDITGTWINKLYELKYDGNKIIYFEYDTYSNPNAFIPSQSSIYNKIIKRDLLDTISYRICGSENEIKNDNCAKLISFYKSSIIDKKE